MLTNLPVPYDLCIGVPILHLLTVGLQPFNIVSKYIICESGEGPGEASVILKTDGLFAALIFYHFSLADVLCGLVLAIKQAQ